MGGNRAAEETPEPPWLGQRTSRRTRPPVGRQEVIAAALRVVVADGVAGLTMRRVASEVGGGTSTLYWHVRDKGQLLELVVDQLVGEIQVPAKGTWSRRLVGFGQDARRVLRKYPGLAQVILQQGAAGPRAVELAEVVLGILRQAELSDLDLWAGYHTLLTYVTGFVLGETWPRPGDGSDRRRATAAYISSLPLVRFPNIYAASTNLTWDDDARFAFGLDHLIYALGRLHRDG